MGRLVAESFEQSVHIQIDDFMRFIVNGWVDPWLPESASQNEVLGVSVAVSAIQFAVGGYTVVVDGHLFPDGVDGMAHLCGARGSPCIAPFFDRISRRASDVPRSKGSAMGGSKAMWLSFKNRTSGSLVLVSTRRTSSTRARALVKSRRPS